MNGNPLAGDVDPRMVARMMKSTDRLAGLLQREVPGMGATPAAIFADIVNVIRADTKQLATVHDVEVEIEMMSEDRAAELIAGVTDGNGVEIVRVFNEIAEKRDVILREVLDDDEYEQFMAAKTAAMHTNNPGTFDETA
jgi:hypothetical protein